METDMTDASSGTPTPTPSPASAPARTGRHRRWLLGAGTFVAVLALMLVAGNAFGVSAQGMRGIGPGRMMPNGNGGNGMMGPFGFGHGIRAVVTGVDTGANTITLAGLPQQITTVKLDNTVKLETLQADGTTKPAAIGDFKSGTLVRIGIGRGNGSNGSNGGTQPTGTPGANQGRFGFAINDLAIVPDNIAEVSGLVIANNNGTYTIAADGGLRLTVKTQGNTTYTSARNAAATAADVKVGTRIIVNGTQAPDGITATTVRVMDFSNFPMGNGNGGNGSNRPMPNGPRATPKATATT